MPIYRRTFNTHAWQTCHCVHSTNFQLLIQIINNPNTFITSSPVNFNGGEVLNMPPKEVTSPTKVCFSKGNLQAICDTAGDENSATYSWRFATNQWDYIGDTGGNTTLNDQKTGNVVDLFYWVGTNATLSGDFTKYGIAIDSFQSNKSSALKADWAEISTLPMISGRKWYTLAIDEWSYLFSTRKVIVGDSTNKPFGYGNVNGVNGWILLPDDWDGSKCTWFDYGPGSQNIFNDQTDPMWSVMEAAGCVFLPLSGRRYGLTMGEIDSGFYWSSSVADTDNLAKSFTLRQSKVNTASNCVFYGQSVRLVSAPE